MVKKVAVVADVMMEYGGAEKVTETMLKIFSKADLYTLFIVPAARKRLEKEFPGIKIRTSIFQKFIYGNKVSKYISIIKLFSWIYWELLDLKKYDLIISSSHSFMSKNVLRGKNAFHLAYVHTPPRFLYKEFCEIGIIRKFPLNIILWPIMEILRWIDRRGSTRPDVMAVNSDNVRGRVKKYYGREPVVVYPSVEVGPIGMVKKRDYFVSLSRLVKQKGIDLAVKVCGKNNIPLVVLGNGGEINSLKSMSGRMIDFVEGCSDEKKFEVIKRARALIYTPIEEDFGIVPVEALKMGVPVITYNSGGVSETVIDGKNGVLFDNFTEVSLLAAIKRFQKMSFSRDECVKSVQKFSFLNFKKQIMSLIPT